MKNFVFIDSFYKNTYHLLAINCQKLLEAWTQLADNGSLFHFLSKIVSDHGCIFMPVPDYIAFNGKTKQEDIKAKFEDGILRLAIPKVTQQQIEDNNYIAIEG